MRKSSNNHYPIDLVLIWVDGNDPKWRKEFNKLKGIYGDSREERFRDMDTLKYWFRGVDKYVPWFRKLFFVTCGQKPEWLNINHPKLVCVDHKDFIPSQYLPTFSSHCIELNLHRIKGLSEHFVYFNDDTFIMGPTTKNDFFIDGLPCDSAVMNYFSPKKEPLNLVPYVNTAVINRHFDKKKVVFGQASKFFTPKYHKYILKNIQFSVDRFFPGFKYFHLPSSFLKSVFSDVWEAEPDLLDRTCSHKLRVLTDVNQWLFQNWQICTKRFVPRDTSISYYGSIEDKKRLYKTVDAIRSKKYKIICANDADIKEFDLLKRELVAAFESVLPEKSSFEL